MFAICEKSFGNVSLAKLLPCCLKIDFQSSASLYNYYSGYTARVGGATHPQSQESLRQILEFMICAYFNFWQRIYWLTIFTLLWSFRHVCHGSVKFCFYIKPFKFCRCIYYVFFF